MSAPTEVDPKEREVLDHPFPEDPVAYFRQHGYSGRKGFYTQEEAVALGERVWALHDQMQATLPADMPPIMRSLPWPISTIPDDLVADMRLTELTDLARELLDGQEPHVLSWQAFARRAGSPATPWHSDDVAVPIDGPCVAFWIPLTHVPARTGLVALADVDGTGLRPARQAELNPGDLTWHNMTVVHKAEDCPVDFLAFGIAIAGDQARIDLGDWPQLRGMRGQLCSRLSPNLRHRGSVVTEQTPALASLGN
ncbi:MAG: phytanoyl-CoA dioxygenase family protein [Actinomycetota bacterium]